MFSQEELNYLLSAVQLMSITSTQEGRNKAAMTTKLCNLLDDAAAPKEEKGKPKGK